MELVNLIDVAEQRVGKRSAALALLGRTALGFSVKDLSERCGVSRSSISRLENGESVSVDIAAAVDGGLNAGGSIIAAFIREWDPKVSDLPGYVADQLVGLLVHHQAAKALAAKAVSVQPLPDPAAEPSANVVELDDDRAVAVSAEAYKILVDDAILSLDLSDVDALSSVGLDAVLAELAKRQGAGSWDGVTLTGEALSGVIRDLSPAALTGVAGV